MAPNFLPLVDQVTESEWNGLLPQFADASIYQTWAYGAVSWGEKNLSHLLLKDGEQIVGMAQVRLVRLPVIGKGIAYVRWGPLWRPQRLPVQQEILRQILLALKAEYADKRGLVLRIVPNIYSSDPFADTWRASSEPLGFAPAPQVHVYRTMRVDLAQSAEDLRKGLHQRWRNYLRNAERAGYSLREGANLELYEIFLGLYGQMMGRKQFETTVDVDQFKLLQAALPDPLKMQVFLCERNGQALNALVVSHVGESAIYLLAATGDDGLKERGAHLLQWRAMQWLQERRCRWYDLGGINPDRNPGVFQFKSGLGGEEVRQLGGFEVSSDLVSRLCTSGGESLQSLMQSMNRVLKRH